MSPSISSSRLVDVIDRAYARLPRDSTSNQKSQLLNEEAVREFGLEDSKNPMLVDALVSGLKAKFRYRWDQKSDGERVLIDMS